MAKAVLWQTVLDPEPPLAATKAMRSWPRNENHVCGDSRRIVVKATRARNATTFALLAAARGGRRAVPWLMGLAAGRHQAVE